MKSTKFTKPEILASLERPAALTGVNPRNIEGVNWWKRTRQAVYRSTHHHCIACGVHQSEAKHRQWLEAHESYKIDFNTGIIELEGIYPLCHFCHHFIHRERIKVLYKAGKASQEYYSNILTHGMTLLHKHKLSPQKMPADNIEWQAWRLYYKGNYYQSKFESESQKLAYFDWINGFNQQNSNDNLDLFLKTWEATKLKLSVVNTGCSYQH